MKTERLSIPEGRGQRQIHRPRMTSGTEKPEPKEEQLYINTRALRHRKKTFKKDKALGRQRPKRGL